MTPDSNGVTSGSVVDVVDPGLSYPVRMVGNPSLFTVRFLYAGCAQSQS